MKAKAIVTAPEQVLANIKTYEDALPHHPELVARMGMHPAWYAAKNEQGEWIFGPSKFIGYKDAQAASYLASYERQDGRETESALRLLAEPVPIDSALGQELSRSFRDFAAQYGRTPKQGWRVSLLRQPQTERSRPANAAPISPRIAFDPNICGGRAHIRGTRMRVSDILDMLGSGVDRAEMLADFPYISNADIDASLQYAAASVAHRVLRAA